jgi:hypothetical protein
MEGMVEHDTIIIYVGTCAWENSFEYCLKEFVLTVFHELMHVLCPDIDEFVPYAEKVLAEILEGACSESARAKKLFSILARISSIKVLRRVSLFSR